MNQIGVATGPHREVLALPLQAAAAAGLFGVVEPPIGYAYRVEVAGVEFGEAISAVATNFSTLQFKKVVGVTATAVGASYSTTAALAAHTKKELIARGDFVYLGSSERLKLDVATAGTGAALPEGQIYIEYTIETDPRGRI